MFDALFHATEHIAFFRYGRRFRYCQIVSLRIGQVYFGVRTSFVILSFPQILASASESLRTCLFSTVAFSNLHAEAISHGARLS